MTYNEQIVAIIDEVRPQFELLGMYAFHGEGEPNSREASVDPQLQKLIMNKDTRKELKASLISLL